MTDEEQTSDADSGAAGFRLIPVDPGSLLDALTLTPDGLLIGKSAEVFQQYKKEILVELNYLSRKHAAIEGSEGRYTIQDNGSTNGTLVNNSALEAGRPVQLRDGDLVVFGHEFFSYRVSDRGGEIPSPYTEASSSDTVLFSSSINELGRVLQKKATPTPRLGDPLMNAATLVGSVDGISIKAPGASANVMNDTDPIEAIARASLVRFRHVILAGEWWKKDCGAMLGYLEEGDVPVALLQTGGGYQIVNPETGQSQRLNRTTMATLKLKAVTFYRSLPEDLNSVWEIPRWSLRGRYKDLFYVGVLSLIITVIGMLVPQVTALMIDNAIPNANTRLITEVGLAMIFAAFGTALFGLASTIMSIRIGVVTDSVSQSAVWNRILNLKPSLFKEFGHGDLLDRASGISAVTRELNGLAMGAILTGLIMLLNLCLLYWYNGKLATMVLVLGLIVTGVSVFAGVFIRGYYRSLMELQGKFFGFVVELLSATNKIRVAGAQRRAFTQWTNRYTQQLGLMLKAQEIEDYIVVMNGAVPAVSAIFLYGLSAGLLNSGTESVPLSVGILLAFNTAMGSFLGSLTALSKMALDFLDTSAKAERTRPLLEAKPEVTSEDVDPGQLHGKIQLSNVRFQYNDEGPEILKGIDVQIEPGQFVALVGPSGSGKSTIFRLLLGFEEPVSGKVNYDDQDLAQLDITAVRRQLGVVMQNPRINAGSILDNIGAGAPISMEQAWNAATDAGLAEDIKQLPMGLHTVVSEGGGNFSGGQRQRLMIARALVRDPSILLFDEATSALDNKTQAIVSNSLLKRSVTRVVIAHRLSTIREADQIYVLDNGAVVESGNFQSLSESGGLFATMMQRQSGGG